jgi:hypothetical protein
MMKCSISDCPREAAMRSHVSRRPLCNRHYGEALFLRLSVGDPPLTLEEIESDYLRPDDHELN